MLAGVCLKSVRSETEAPVITSDNITKISTVRLETYFEYDMKNEVLVEIH